MVFYLIISTSITVRSRKILPQNLYFYPLIKILLNHNQEEEIKTIYTNLSLNNLVWIPHSLIERGDVLEVLRISKTSLWHQKRWESVFWEVSWRISWKNAIKWMFRWSIKAKEDYPSLTISQNELSISNYRKG
jgi:hypothetical protein